MKPVLQYVDAVTIPVPDLDRGLAFYRDVLGHQLIWRNEATGQAGLRTPVLMEPIDIPIGRLTVVADPFGNRLVLLDSTKGTYDTDESGAVTGVS
jgi:catechol 2,3-dioxygenase-like lactoylglutathione lyase family enzyme